VSNWTDNGLFSDAPRTFSGFGTDAMFPTRSCQYFERLVNGQWQTYNNAPICGDLITFPAKS